MKKPKSNPSALTIDLVKQGGNWAVHKGLTTNLKRDLKTLWPLFGEADDAAFTLCLSTNQAVQVLNKQYRGKDKPTNVLSFPSGADLFLGDVILAYETVEAEAAGEHKDFYHHSLHLCVHGLLHLLGYDHETEDEAEIMEALEIKLLAHLGIPNPYQPV